MGFRPRYDRGPLFADTPFHRSSGGIVGVLLLIVRAIWYVVAFVLQLIVWIVMAVFGLIWGLIWIILWPFRRLAGRGRGTA